MNLAPRSLRRLVAWSATGAIACLATAGIASAAPSAPTVSFNENPTAADATVVNIGGSLPDPAGGALTYELSVNGGAFTPFTSGDTINTTTSGTYQVAGRAVQSGVDPSTATSASVLVDKASPTVTVAVAPTSILTAGWYRTLTFNLTCADDNPISCAPVTWTTPGAAQTYQALVTDMAGKTGLSNVLTFNFDATPPTIPVLVSPGALVPGQPTFSWSTATDALSGMDRYELQWQRDDDDFDSSNWKVLATRQQASGNGDYTVAPSDYTATSLPENVPLVWRVVAIDTAGNRRATSNSGRKLLIDPTVPPAPSITGGPNAPTQNTSPTFTWEGTGQSFRWWVTAADNTTVRTGTTTGQSAGMSGLPDGAYVFHVTQYTAAARESAEATRSFVVDTTPPAAPIILTRPTFPSVTDAIFTWATEPGAYSRWSVIDSSGNAVVPPTDTPVTSATLPALADGTYTFQLQQIDAADNVSPATSEAFTVIAPLVPPSGGNGTITILPKQNAKRLQPKAGKILTSRTPVLRWSRGPRGTKLFNLQIFRVTRAKGAATPKVTKILSVFPKGRAYRVPKGKTRPKTCYVWRVWPYTGREFTPKPLGVSNYCIASKKVLARKAALIAKKKAELKAKKAARRY